MKMKNVEESIMHVFMLLVVELSVERVYYPVV